MTDLPIHVVLFGVVAAAIVAMTVVFSESDNRGALKSLPKRLLWFYGGCAALAAVMLFLEHVFASVD